MSDHPVFVPVSVNPAFIRLEKEIKEKAVKEFMRMVAQNPNVEAPVNACSVMNMIERGLWRRAAMKLVDRDTAALQVLLEIAGER